MVAHACNLSICVCVYIHMQRCTYVRVHVRFGSHFVGSEDQTQAIRPKCKCLVRSPHLGDRDRKARFQGHLQLYTVQGQSKLHESLFQKNQSRLNSNMCQVVTILDLEIWGRKYSR